MPAIRLNISPEDRKIRRKLMSVYVNMRHRCLNPNFHNFSLYGGRGIKVCDDWLLGFSNFYNWALLNGYKEGLQIDRQDNDKEYSPQNCRWVSGLINTRNRKVTLFATLNGERKPLTEWAEILGVDYCMVHKRIKYHGYSDEDALTKPSRLK